MASAYSSLKQGFGSGLEIEVGSWLRARGILALDEWSVTRLWPFSFVEESSHGDGK